MKTYLVIFVACALSGVVLPVPEELPLLAAGAGITEGWAFAFTCVAGGLGVLARDALFYALGRMAGEGVFRWRLVQAVIGARRLARARAAVRTRGPRAVLLARCAVGLRGVSFLVAGALGVRARDFFAWDLLGVCVTVPLVVGLGTVAGEPAAAAMRWVAEHAGLVFALIGVLAVAWLTRAIGEHPPDPCPPAAARPPRPTCVGLGDRVSPPAVGAGRERPCLAPTSGL